MAAYCWWGSLLRSAKSAVYCALLCEIQFPSKGQLQTTLTSCNSVISFVRPLEQAFYCIWKLCPAFGNSWGKKIGRWLSLRNGLLWGALYFQALKTNTWCSDTLKQSKWKWKGYFEKRQHYTNCPFKSPVLCLKVLKVQAELILVWRIPLS